MKKILLLSVACCLALALRAQSADDPVVFEINGQKILKSEFMREFGRSIESPSALTTSEKRQALADYAGLFVNFRAKLADARAKGFDTLPSLKRELSGYRKELAAPYLIDSVSLENIMREAYERNHYTLHAQHILVLCAANALPEDTLKAYNKAMEYYNRAIKGEDFLALAKEANEVRFKQEMVPLDDPRRRDNGDLGNFTAFDMVYPFETLAYGLEVGEISKPGRTRYGYHVVKLVDKNPYFGRVSFQHIWCAERDNGVSESVARDAYRRLGEGESFAKVCVDCSDDQSTASNGGLFNDLSIRQIPAEYVEHLALLKDGEYSAPFHTSYGWHIVRLVNRDTLPSFEQMVPTYKQRLVRDSRSEGVRRAFVDQCKERYQFVDFTQMYMKQAKNSKAPKRMLASLDECKQMVNDSVFSRQWTANGKVAADQRPLFKFADKEYTTQDLLRYIDANQHAERSYDLGLYVENRYQAFIDDELFAYADSQLETEYPEFRDLVGEYRNGLMIFAYNDEMVWSKALLDTAGFEAFYARTAATRDINNPDEAPYFWGERAQLLTVSIDDSTLLPPAKAMKLIKKAQKKQWSADELSAALNAAFNVKDSVAHLSVASQLVEKEASALATNEWAAGTYLHMAGNGYKILWVQAINAPCLKSITEARGHYVSDYQNYLEKQLIERLRSQYNVKIYQNVLEQINY